MWRAHRTRGGGRLTYSNLYKSPTSLSCCACSRCGFRRSHPCAGSASAFNINTCSSDSFCHVPCHLRVGKGMKVIASAGWDGPEICPRHRNQRVELRTRTLVRYLQAMTWASLTRVTAHEGAGLARELSVYVRVCSAMRRGRPSCRGKRCI